MNPKTLYSLIFWGLIFQMFAWPMGGVDVVPALGYLMIARAAWLLGNYSKSFRLVAVAAALLTVLTLPTPYLPENVSEVAALVAKCVLGWALLSCVARDCQAHGQIDLAAGARFRRVLYVAIMGGVPLAMMFLPVERVKSPVLLMTPFVALVVAYVVLVWTVQSAKIRLFP